MALNVLALCSLLCKALTLLNGTRTWVVIGTLK